MDNWDKQVFHPSITVTTITQPSECKESLNYAYPSLGFIPDPTNPSMDPTDQKEELVVAEPPKETEKDVVEAQLTNSICFDDKAEASEMPQAQSEKCISRKKHEIVTNFLKTPSIRPKNTAQLLLRPSSPEDSSMYYATMGSAGVLQSDIDIDIG